MHVHEAPAGVAGPVVIDITASIVVNAGGVLFASGSTPVDAGFVDALRAGIVYVSIHTALNPMGEVRGQVLSAE